MMRDLVVLFLLLLLPMVASSETFNIVGDDDFPPYSFIDSDKKIKGIDIDMLNEMAKRLGVKVNIQLVPWKRLLRMTENGDVFGSFSLFKTPEREQYGLFTYPIHYSTYELFVTKNSNVKFDRLEDLYGKRVGLPAGFAISTEFDTARARGDIKVVEFFNYEETFRRLIKGGVDAFAGNELVVKYKLKNKSEGVKGLSNIIALPKALKKSRRAFFVLSKKFPKKDKLIWKTRITSILETMDKEGVTNSIVQKYTE